MSQWEYLSAFGLDRTLLRGNSSFQLCLHLISKKKLPRWALFYSIFCYLLHRLGVLSLKQLHHKVFNRWLRGFSLVTLSKEVDNYLLKFKESRYYLPAMHQFRLAKKAGHFTLLLSNAPSFLVEKIAHFLGFDAVFASDYAVDKEQKLCKISTILVGENKAEVLKAYAQKCGIKIENTIA